MNQPCLPREQQCAAARALRPEFARVVEDGRSPSEVRHATAASFGEEVQLTPPASGFAGLVWILPVVGAVLGLAGVGYAFWRWRGGGASRATPADRELVRVALGDGRGHGGAVAAVTGRIRIGALITPLARRRPWKLARETVALDHLSGGRLVLPVGLGALDDLRAELTGRGIVLALARVKQDLLDALDAYGLITAIGPDLIFPTLPTAVAAYRAWRSHEPRTGQE